ncbi:MAG: hypothetical protein FADNKDHG_01454 [Holosporales bacterium]
MIAFAFGFAFNSFLFVSKTKIASGILSNSLSNANGVMSNNFTRKMPMDKIMPMIMNAIGVRSIKPNGIIPNMYAIFTIYGTVAPRSKKVILLLLLLVALKIISNIIIVPIRNNKWE